MNLQSLTRKNAAGLTSARSEVTRGAKAYSSDEWSAMSVATKINMGYALLETIPTIGAKVVLMRNTRNGVAPCVATIGDITASAKHLGDNLYKLEVVDTGEIIKYYGQTAWVWRGSLAKPCTKHEAVETGMSRSWCRHCNVDMEFNMTLGFVPKGTKV